MIPYGVALLLEYSRLSGLVLNGSWKSLEREREEDGGVAVRESSRDGGDSAGWGPGRSPLGQKTGELCLRGVVVRGSSRDGGDAVRSLLG